MSDNDLIIERKRNEGFSDGYEPLADHAHLQAKEGTVRGPISFLNPTKATFSGIQQAANTVARIVNAVDQNASSPPVPAQGDADFQWRARDNRKGRHTIVARSSKQQLYELESTSTLSATAKGIWRMMTVFPVWDISYLVAVIFTLGSIVWCINACFVFLPATVPNSAFKNEVVYGGGWTAWIGATIFEIGSWLMMLEVINKNRRGCFGWALEHVIRQRLPHNNSSGVTHVVRLRPDHGACVHHHQERKIGGEDWQWWPSWTELKTHYFRELGFLATLSQLTGATIFWIAGFTDLPQLTPSTHTLADAIFWTPQVVGGTGFILSGVLFLLETQDKWYKPAMNTLGWHVAFWNLIGGIGFTLSGAFGYSTSAWAQYQSTVATFWGSWAFLIGSLIQWYESLSKFPVEYEHHGPGDTSNEVEMQKALSLGDKQADNININIRASVTEKEDDDHVHKQRASVSSSSLGSVVTAHDGYDGEDANRRSSIFDQRISITEGDDRRHFHL